MHPTLHGLTLVISIALGLFSALLHARGAVVVAYFGVGLLHSSNLFRPIYHECGKIAAISVLRDAI